MSNSDVRKHPDGRQLKRHPRCGALSKTPSPTSPRAGESSQTASEIQVSSSLTSSHLTTACYVMLHMIPINPCDCSHKHVSDNSSRLILRRLLSLAPAAGQADRVSQNPLLYRILWPFASTLYCSSGDPLGASLSRSFLLINRRMCIISSPPLPL